MEFGVLGQLEAWREGERLALGPIKQRSLLALLVIHANQAVSTDLAASQSTLPFIPARIQLYVVDCVDHSASLAANGVRVRLCRTPGRERGDAQRRMAIRCE